MFNLKAVIMKKSEKFASFFLAVIMAIIFWFCLLTFNPVSKVEETEKESVVIIKQDLPSRYGGWRIQ
jgi:hypothetical protein